MIVLLDTNVFSEPIRESPDPAVEAWVAGRPLENLFFSAVGEAELRYGTLSCQQAGTEIRSSRKSRRCCTMPSRTGSAVRQRRRKHIRRCCRHALFRRSSRRSGGLPDRGDRAITASTARSCRSICSSTRPARPSATSRCPRRPKAVCYASRVTRIGHMWQKPASSCWH